MDNDFNNFEGQIMDFLHKVKKLNPDKETRAKMTKAGAKVLNDKLQQVARTKHYDPKHYVGKHYRDKNVKHLADSVTFVGNNINGDKDGSSLVGFQGVKESGVNHARIARFLNDGTKKMRGDHFVEHTRKDNAAAIFKANAEVYRRSIKGDDKP